MDASARPRKPRRTLCARFLFFLDPGGQNRTERRALAEILAKPHDHWLDDIGLRRQDFADAACFGTEAWREPGASPISRAR